MRVLIIILATILLSGCQETEQDKFLEKLALTMGNDYQKIKAHISIIFPDNPENAMFEIAQEYNQLSNEFKNRDNLLPHTEPQLIDEVIARDFPDFYVKKLHKIKRYAQICFILNEFPKDNLKYFPDLFTNTMKLQERIHIKQLPELTQYIIKNQNEDGSWGTENKIFCTSIIVQSFLNAGETPTSRKYGKYIVAAYKYLTKLKQINDKDLPYLTWAVCEMYSMTGISMIEEQAEKLTQRLLKNIIQPDKNLNPSSEQFLIESYALKSAYTTGLETKILPETIYYRIEQAKKAYGKNPTQLNAHISLFIFGEYREPESITASIIDNFPNDPFKALTLAHTYYTDRNKVRHFFNSHNRKLDNLNKFSTQYPILKAERYLMDVAFTYLIRDIPECCG